MYFFWSNQKLPGWEHARTVAWSNDMEGHARKCVKMLRVKQKDGAIVQIVESLLDDHHYKKEELEYAHNVS